MSLSGFPAPRRETLEAPRETMNAIWPWPAPKLWLETGSWRRITSSTPNITSDQWPRIQIKETGRAGSRRRDTSVRTAILLAEAGATVVLIGRRIAPLQDVVAVIEKAGGKAVAQALDVASREAILDAVAWVKSNVGSIRHPREQRRQCQQGAECTVHQRGGVERHGERQSHGCST